MRLVSILIAIFIGISCSPFGSEPPESASASDRTTSTILKSYAESWKGDEEFLLEKAITLGIWIDGAGYTVNLTNDGGEFLAVEPDSFDWGFETDLATLQKLDSGNLNALTAMGQARATDPIPLNIRLPDNFSEDSDIRGFFIPLTLHFWNREWPETIKFGEGQSRFVHGANTSVLIYDEGLRSAWYQLKSGMHINADSADQLNDFDTALVITKGKFRGRIDGVEREFNEGETVLVPAGVSHEFYAEDDEYGEFIILMWGDGA